MPLKPAPEDRVEQKQEWAEGPGAEVSHRAALLWAQVAGLLYLCLHQPSHGSMWPWQGGPLSLRQSWKTSGCSLCSPGNRTSFSGHGRHVSSTILVGVPFASHQLKGQRKCPFSSIKTGHY